MWLTLAAVKACREALDILRRLPDRRPDDERMLEEGAREMRGSLMRFAWEGDRFLYGFTDWDEPVGSRTCAQGSFMLNPQTCAILPDNPALADSGVEPYAVTNMYIGPDNPCDAGFAPCSWITGTAGWHSFDASSKKPCFIRMFLPVFRRA